MGICTGSQSTEENSGYHCQTTGGLEFKKALGRSHHSSQPSQTKPSREKIERKDETQDEETDSHLTLRLR